MPDPIFFLDTTLRVHEPSSGIDFSVEDKLELAAALAAAGVDVIEAGQPAKSSAQNEAVRRVATEIRSARIGAIAPCEPQAIEVAAEAIRPAAQARLHVYIIGDGVERSVPTSKGAEETIARAASMVRMARNLAADVEFSLVDATRADPGFLAEIVRRTIAAGAATINLPDVGFVLPDDLGASIARLYRDVPELEGAVLSFHGHDDLGLATANAIAAVRAGARQIEGAVNGLGGGERNTPLEQVALALRVHGDRLGVGTRVDTSRLLAVTKLVEERTGTPSRPSRWWNEGA
jgi:2-isopropylmalate synthase